MTGTTGGHKAASALQRQQLIRERVQVGGTVTLDELVELLGVSRMTVHRDLDTLAGEGALRRVRGGATAQRSSLFESDFPYRLASGPRVKAGIGRAAVRLLETGQAVICDESTTTLAALRQLGPEEHLTVITNCVPTMQYVSATSRHRLIGIGGDYVPTYQAFLGLLSEQTIASVFADVLLASCSAVRGLSTYHQDQQIVATKRAMLRVAPRRILLLDSSKIDAGALYHLGSIADFTHLVTDSAAPQMFLDAVADTGVEIVVADPGQDTGDESEDTYPADSA